MIAELFTNNALNLVIIFGSCAALILMSFWFRRGNRKRKGFLFHAVQFLIYTIIISAVGSIINYVIDILNKDKTLVRFISKDLSLGVYTDSVSNIFGMFSKRL